MPYSRTLVSQPAAGEPVAAAAFVTALTAFVVQKTGLDHSTVEWVIIALVGLASTIYARQSVTPVSK